MIFKEDCGFFELCPFQILKYLIIYQRCETAGVSKGALLEGQLVISIEALNSKHQANTLHCVTTSNTPKFDTTELPCSRIHPVLGHPVMLFIPDDVVGMGLLGELTLTPAVALCPCPKPLYIFLYGPSGLPLIFPNSEQPTTAVFKDASYFIDWKKYRLSLVPNLDLSLDSSVLPDVSYQVESGEGDQSQNMGPQGQTVLLFLFVDFHRGFPGQKMELWGVHTLLSAHLRAILRESHSVVQGCIQAAVARALEQHRQAVKAHQKLQASLSVAVDSIMSIMTGSTNSSFRKTCLQTLQAADTQEFGTKLHKSFQEVTQHRFLYHCSHEVKQ
ncbi:hypothetical protein MG293_020032, partial [Ovis ammon polii]